MVVCRWCVWVHAVSLCDAKRKVKEVAMPKPPTHQPIVDERDGDWLGTATTGASIIFWDYVPLDDTLTPRVFETMQRYAVDELTPAATIPLDLSSGNQTREYKLINASPGTPFVTTIDITLDGEGDYVAIEFIDEFDVTWTGVSGTAPDTNTAGSTLVTIRQGHAGLEFVA